MKFVIAGDRETKDYEALASRKANRQLSILQVKVRGQETARARLI
jgi:beta-lactamase superfamily II metal-dependent hydrolase